MRGGKTTHRTPRSAAKLCNRASAVAPKALTRTGALDIQNRDVFDLHKQARRFAPRMEEILSAPQCPARRLKRRVL